MIVTIYGKGDTTSEDKCISSVRGVGKSKPPLELWFYGVNRRRGYWRFLHKKKVKPGAPAVG
jgi:hypothetical protein